MVFLLIEKKELIEKYLDYFWRNLTDPQALMIIDMDGNILDSKIAECFKNEYDVMWQKRIAKKISLRFPMADFYTELGGLEITVNLFKKYAVINRMINFDKILVVITKKIALDIATSLGIISNSENWPKL